MRGVQEIQRQIERVFLVKQHRICLYDVRVDDPPFPEQQILVAVDNVKPVVLVQTEPHRHREGQGSDRNLPVIGTHDVKMLLNGALFDRMRHFLFEQCHMRTS